MSPIPTRMTAALVAVTTAVTLTACTSPADSTQSGQTGSGNSGAPLLAEEPAITGEPAGYNADDVLFVTNMISDHQQAIELSRLVADRTANPELVELADRMAAAQQPEINIMNVFLVQWNENPEARTGPSAREDPANQGPDVPGMVDDATVEKLKSLHGTEFDTLWLTSMISHQQEAAEMADAEIANGVNVDAVAMARTMAARQEAEIEQMRQILEGSQP
ncbi:MAG: DUF305 domain-containing protein [Actinomycetia bacterium]|nr:DUF305 domain-containing protein [Actinomycetes bacterium]